MSKNREHVRVELVSSKSVHGSLSSENYSDDTAQDVIDWLTKLMKEVPKAHRELVFVRIESVGGYEGEHHTEVTVYYERPETDEEMAARLRRAEAYQQRLERQERAAYEALKAKFG